MDISYFTTYDLPVPYKKLKIYPVRVKDFMHFSGFSQCLLLEKNYVPDVKIIAMTELEYIYHLTLSDPKNNPQLIWLDRLLSLVLRDEHSFDSFEESMLRYSYNEKKRPVFSIGDEIYDSVDFEEIKKIVCEQNLIELPDENISKEVRDSLEAARRYKEKHSGSSPGTFEDYIVTMGAVTGWTMEYIYEMTARKFISAIRRMDNYVHYRIYLAAALSGNGSFKDTSIIKHWLSNINSGNDRYADVSTNLDDIKEKVSLESAKQAP